MKFQISSLTLLCLFLFQSCSIKNNRENTIIIEKFPIVNSLKGKSIPNINNDFYPMFVQIIDSLLIFCDYDSSPHFFIYAIPEMRYIGEFGNQGNSPHDINDPLFWGQVFKENDTYKIWVYQMNKMKFTLLDIKNYLNNHDAEPEEKIFMPAVTGTNVNILYLKSGVVIGTGIEADGEFFSYEQKDNTFTWIPFIDDLNATYKEEVVRNNLLSMLKLGNIKAKPDGTKFVKSHFFSPIIDVYDDKLNRVFSILNGEVKSPKVNKKVGEFEETSNVYYINTYLTDNYIYALNVNCNIYEYSNGFDNVLIDIFDWSGNPIRQLILNEGIIQTGAFSVDEENKTIYTINPKSEFDYYTKFSFN